MFRRHRLTYYIHVARKRVVDIMHVVKILLFIALLFAEINTLRATTNTASAGATWSGATWSLGHVPLSTEDVVINSGINLNIDIAAVCGSLTIGDATSLATTVTLGASGSIAINGTSGNLIFNPSNVNQAFVLDIATRTLSVSGTLIFPTINTSTITLCSGTATFSNLVILSANGKITFQCIGLGTVNFNGGLTDNATGLTTISGSTVNLGGNYTVNNTSVIWNNNANIKFSGSCTITPNASITFGHLTINSAATVAAAGDLSVLGSWTNNGGTFMPGTYTVSFTGTSGSQLDGTANSATFYNLTIARGAGNLYTDGNIATITTQDLTLNSGHFNLVANISTNLTINGNFLFTGGTLSYGPAINIYGNWTRNGGSWVGTAASELVTFYGTGTTTLGGSQLTVFDNLTINKSSPTDILQLTGVETTVIGNLTLTNGGLDLNSQTLRVYKAITRSSPAYIKSETSLATNPSKIISMFISATAGSTYVFPFGISSAVSDYIPLTFINQQTASTYNITVSTRATPASDNLPLA
ncbi:MAG: hypothetical protein JNL63_13335, partial [Bacteroidia bacterium]|nr:hypothetical protein [Bacteroidia bacterium]